MNWRIVKSGIVNIESAVCESNEFDAEMTKCNKKSIFPHVIPSIRGDTSHRSMLNGSVSYRNFPSKIFIWAPMAITLTITIDTMEPQRAPFVLNFSEIIPMVKSPRSVPDVMPLKAMPMLKTLPSFSTTKTSAKQTQPVEGKFQLVFKLLFALESYAK